MVRNVLWRLVRKLTAKYAKYFVDLSILRYLSCWLFFIGQELFPAIHSQSFVLNSRTKGFPLLSGLGHFSNEKSREGLQHCLSSFCAGVQREKASVKSPALVDTPKKQKSRKWLLGFFWQLFLFQFVFKNFFKFFNFGLDDHLAIRLIFVVLIIILMVIFGFVKLGERL